MIALIQRVLAARVEVEGRTIGAIEQGVLALIGVRRDDTPAAADRLLERIVTYRIFADDAGRMNRSLAEIRGGLLLVLNSHSPPTLARGPVPDSARRRPPKRLARCSTTWSRRRERATRRWPPASSALTCGSRWSMTALSRSGSKREEAQRGKSHRREARRGEADNRA